MTKARMVLLILLAAGLLAATGALAQGEALILKLSRDWGYGGLNGDIQGTFTLSASGPANLARVEFYIDDTPIGEAPSAPFKLQFVTDNYPLGAHRLWAVGHTSDGQALRSQEIGATFVSASAGKQAVVRIIVPLLVIVFGAMLLSVVVSMVTGRKTRALPPGTPRRYPLGGGICPKCGRPLVFHLLGLNLGVGKLERCPHCGRWSVVRRAPLEQLRAAEQAEISAAADQIPGASEEEALRRALDDSKYQRL